MQPKQRSVSLIMQCHNTWRKVMYNLSLLFGFVAVFIIVVLFCGFREGLLCSRVCVILIFFNVSFVLVFLIQGA